MAATLTQHFTAAGTALRGRTPQMNRRLKRLSPDRSPVLRGASSLSTLPLLADVQATRCCYYLVD